jgi:phosphoribosyl-ATP pyrophosphohydrolase
MKDIIARLETVIRDRKTGDEAASYVARLFGEGREALARKLGEEAIETVIAALSQDDDALVGESADLLFHLLILLADRGLTFDDVAAELERREGLSGLDEKASRER